MTLTSFMLEDVAVLSILLLIGFALREIIKPLQKMFLSASVIAGILGLVLGEQVLGIIQLPSSFNEINGPFSVIMMTGLIFGVKITVDRVRSYADYCLSLFAVWAMQIVVGLLLGLLFVKIWPGLYEGWGIIGVWSFFGGHPIAASGGAVFEELGIPNIASMGMVTSTFGMFAAVILGTIVCNVGLRRGWGTYTDKPQALPKQFFGGIIPKEEQQSIGSRVTSSAGISAVMLQLALIMLCYVVGKYLVGFIAMFIPVIGQMPSMTMGMVGAVIIYPIMCKLGISGYVDRPTINEITAFSLEFLIVASIATTSVDILTKYFLPLLLFSLINFVILYFFAKVIIKRFCKKEWFEKFCFVFGQSTGSSATGMLLLREVDPDLQSVTCEAHGVYSGTIGIFNNITIAILPSMIISSIFGVAGAALVIMVLCIGGLVLLNRGKA